MPSTTADPLALAKATFRKHHGRDWAALRSPHDPPVADDLFRLRIQHTYGDTWSRPGLDLKAKSLVTLTVLVAQGAGHEFKTHIRGAHHLGITKAEIIELMIHLLAYLGAPRTVTATQLVQEVWAEMAAEDAAGARAKVGLARKSPKTGPRAGQPRSNP